jgi:SAM-dependent methyltransferase
MTRWSRANRYIRANVPEGSAVLDLGCAFGFGSKGLAGEYRVVGVDINLDEVSRAPEALWGRAAADATRLPFADGTFRAVVCLEVLEHIPHVEAAIAEVARVMQPGGVFVLSVPNRGLLWKLDSYNVMAGLFDPGEIVPPGHWHRHFSAEEMGGLLAPHFRVQRTRWSGLGVSEVLHYKVLLLTRTWSRLRPLYRWARFLYFSPALAEDQVRTGRWGYNLMMVATRRKDGR